MNKTRIPYLDFTWNPVTGCTPVSAGCENCWAKRMHERFSDRPFSKVTLHPERMYEPVLRRKPSRIGVCFMGDIFHEKVPDRFVDRVLATCALCTQHHFLILTKRPGRMEEYFSGTDDLPLSQCPEARVGRECMQIAHERGEDISAPNWDMFFEWPLPNVWLGTSISTQQDADRNIAWLLQTPAALRYVSYEPGLGPVDLDQYLGCGHEGGWRSCPFYLAGNSCCSGIDWVICGGESGPKSRLMDPDWARNLRDQCKEAGVPFFMKQMSGRAPIPEDLRITEFPNIIQNIINPQEQMSHYS